VKTQTKELRAPRLKFLQRITFSMWPSSICLKCIFHIIFQISYWFKKYIYQVLHYNQMYNFALNHDHKFGPIIVIKNLQVSKRKGHMQIFLEWFEHMELFLWNILELTKKLKTFGAHLIRKNEFWKKIKTTSPHPFF
jgi:hypothetical protein